LVAVVNFFLDTRSHRINQEYTPHNPRNPFMKKSFVSLALVLVLGLVGQSFAGWSSLTVQGVRVVQTTTGKRICVITPVSPNGEVGFEIQTSADEKMVDLAMKAVELKTTAWIFPLAQFNFTLRGDITPYPKIFDISGFVLTKP
jgi:hypothetical protein